LKKNNINVINRPKSRICGKLTSRVTAGEPSYVKDMEIITEAMWALKFIRGILYSCN